MNSPRPRIEIKNRTTVLRLINLVKQYPCIWDETDENQNNVKARQDAWLAIARKLGENISLLRRKWRSLRCSYLRVTKERETMQAQCKGTRRPSPSWFAYNDMKFLANGKKRKRTMSCKYLILDEENPKALKECDTVDIVKPDEDAEEIEESLETTPDSNSTEATREYTLTYDLNETLEEETPATMYYENGNANDEIVEESEIPLERRYLNEKRKSILLHELNEKLEKDLEQQAAKIQVLQQMKIALLEKKLENSERKIAKLMATSQVHLARTNPNFRVLSVWIAEQARRELCIKKENNTHEPRSTYSAAQLMPLQDVDEQCDPLCNTTGIMNDESSYETFQLMTS